MDFYITASGRMYQTGREQRPKDPEIGKPVNSYTREVTLQRGAWAKASVRYTSQDVAYFDLDFTVSVRDGNFYRNGQQILTKSGSDYGNLLWGVLWTVTFGLISLFWIPSTTATLHYTEIIPLNSAPIHYTFGGGGDCSSFGKGSTAGFWIDPSRLEAGKVYPMFAKEYCNAGIWAEFGLYASDPRVQWNRQGLPSYASVESPVEGFSLLKGNPTVASGQPAFWYSPPYGNGLLLYIGGTLDESQHPHLPTSLSLNPYQVDRMWTIQESRDVGEARFGSPFDQVTLCFQTNPDNPKFCDGGYSATYRRTSANPPGPVSVTPSWGFPATYVGQSVSRGPNGEEVSQPYVTYSIPSQTLTLTDTFQCISGACP